MKKFIFFICITLWAAPSISAGQSSYLIEKISPDLYAAIAKPASTATSNAFFYIGDKKVVAGGAHMTERATKDLLVAIREATDLPLRYFILPHHHTGYTSVDFYFPAETDIIMTYPVWQSLQKEVIPLTSEATLYSEGLTFKVGKNSIVLTNMGKAHSQGDTLVYFPNEKTLFTSDLLYVNSVGYMGEGNMQGWIMALEFMGQLTIDKVIPGHGPVSPADSISEFKTFYKSFLSEVIKHIEAGNSLEKTRKEFNLPQYRQYSGYEQLLDLNIERAYRNLKETVLSKED